MQPGQTILDVFGGAALGAYDALQAGYRWLGIELEPHFNDIGQGCDCTGLTKAAWMQFYGRWRRVSHTLGHHWCPACLTSLGQVTGTPTLRRRTFRTQPRAGRAVKTKTVLFAPLYLPDRRDGMRPPRPHTQLDFTAQPTTAYARNSGCIPTRAPHHYEGNTERWARQGYGTAVLLHGDSRRLQALLHEKADLVCSSPPYTGSQQVDNRTTKPTALSSTWAKRFGSLTDGHDAANLANLPPGTLPAALAARPVPQVDGVLASPPYASTDTQPTHLGTGKGTRATGQSADRNKGNYHYPTLPENLTNMTPGSVTLAVSSPPYRDALTHGGQRHKPGFTQGQTQGTDAFAGGYGTSPGQLESLPDGTLDCALASPPYADGCTHTGGPDPQLGAMPAAVVASPPWEALLAGGEEVAAQAAWFADRPKTRANHHGGKVGQSINTNYGTAAGQLGQTHGTTFWEAARVILEQVFQVLKPGGHALWVVKAYCRDGKIVDFPGEWRRLCEHVGFVTLHEHHALLTEDHGTQTNLFGEADIVHRTERKSFFRRLHEKKRPDLAINHETVYCMMKPPSDAALPPDEAWQQLPLLEGCVASPPWQQSLESHDTTFQAVARPGRTNQCSEYGQTEGQLGGLPPGHLDACLASPPYAGAGAVLGTHNGIDYSKLSAGGTQRTPAREASGLNYGRSPGQLANLPEGARP